MRSSVQMMQKLATMMAMERMMNVAIFSSFSAEKRFLFISRQSRTRRSRAALTAAATTGVNCVGALGVLHLHVDLADLPVASRSTPARRRACDVHVARVVLVHAAVEDRGDAELLRARHHAHRAEIAERRDERDLVADVDVERLRELAPDDDAGVDRAVCRAIASRTSGSRSSGERTADRRPSSSARRPARCR